MQCIYQKGITHFVVIYYLLIDCTFFLLKSICEIPCINGFNINTIIKSFSN